MIAMRDGCKLYTAVYEPKDTSEKHPILIERTPYGADPYGPQIGWLPQQFSSRNYIIVVQDVRGRGQSEGKFEELRPSLIQTSGPSDTDEKTDAYDTIDWLVKNATNNNGKVGVSGISYPGGYAALTGICGHPAMVAASPQAPTANWFRGDDVHHNGAFFLHDNFDFYMGFWEKGAKNTLDHATLSATRGDDAYSFFLKGGTVEQLNEKFYKSGNRYYNDILVHGDYDEFWQSRALEHQLKNSKTAFLWVGGLFDAEDMYGPLGCYKANETGSPSATNLLVMGPWTHGMWAGTGSRLHDQDWGADTSKFFQEEIELPFFEQHLRGKGTLALTKAMFFDTGKKTWRKFDTWPPKGPIRRLLFGPNHSLLPESPKQSSKDTYVSDPANPVPYAAGKFRGRPDSYLLQDQRFLKDRRDVLSYRTGVLKDDLTMGGEITADLFVTCSGTDADFIVKVIDEYPESAEGKFAGYQMLVRAEVMRAKYRNSLSSPTPLDPSKVERVKFLLNDMLHTFKKGHRVLVQVQSSWFPLVDRNPQKFCDVYHCKPEDFQKATISVLFGPSSASGIWFSDLGD